MNQRLTRRDFLRLGGLALGSLAFRPWSSESPEKRSAALGLVRATVTTVKVYGEPSYESEAVNTLTRDQLVYVYEKFKSRHGPEFNPQWYRIEGGYLHTAYTQLVETRLNTPEAWVPEEGRLAEVTVPLTQSMRYTKFYGWQPLYRLYYRSVHWVTGVDTGPDGKPWYELTDDLLKITYHVRAAHMRMIQPDELTPISPDVSPEDKRVEVSIQQQSLTAYEGDEAVLETKVSTGIPSLPSYNGIPTATPRGDFRVQIKTPVRHMGDGAMTSEVEAYELPGVPWVAFFHEWGVAFHGTYWHDNFGNEMSHGCVNMTMDEAKWLYRWLMPPIEFYEWNAKGRGTRVKVDL